jgi:pimeloyl-ACP methyl ester carboxylesterase
MSDPSYLVRPDGLRLAYRHVPGAGPLIVFLPGYASDMKGSKAEAVADWAATSGRAVLRIDYSGCGESEGRFEDGTLTGWCNDTALIIDHISPERLVLIGSSMGGWLALLLARSLGSRVAGLIGIAAAPDFTQWGFSADEKAIIEAGDRLERVSDYDPEPMITTQAFWQSGQASLLLGGQIAIDCPVRLIQGQCDDDVPWATALTIANRLRSADVQVQLVKDGDHRLSREQDIALLLRTLDALLESL